MNDEIRPSTLASQFVTRSFHISISQAEALTGSAKPRARLHVRSWKFSRVAQASNRHASNYLSVMFPEQGPGRKQIILAQSKNNARRLRVSYHDDKPTSVASTEKAYSNLANCAFG